ncbi:ribose ABC transporter substrate-binding protein RbsB [Deefgea piscis]|uniref:Ribose ABC transporter substrate-binding protein RbsB n=1 Tax=Deefgea piscis TaxID=2739061 RepID=A0A6M8SRY1_9NEIS|nr:ribose ABC transporter substrate-binding protein RbsB [Deefgea piscis]QKJ66838.1 ribose ABC transporter substrate-binding protein RbsB [Deefgea piscis]
MKRILSPLLVGLLAAGLMACSKQGPDTQAASAPATTASGAVTIGLAISTQNNPFFVALRDGADTEAKAQGVTLITVDAQDDSAKQISNIEDLIQKKVQIIMINPTDSDAVAGVVKEAMNAGIKVISLDRNVNGADVSAHIASDNKAGGKMAAEYILEKIGNKGNLVELEGIPGSSAARERGQGFHSVVDGHADVKLVAKQTADFDRAKGLSVMENILQGNKNVTAVFAHNDEMALGAFKAIEAAGLKNVVVVGFDATPDAVKAVKAGQLSATVQQKPELIGKMGVDTAIKLSKGEAVEKSIPVPLALVTQ